MRPRIPSLSSPRQIPLRTVLVALFALLVAAAGLSACSSDAADSVAETAFDDTDSGDDAVEASDAAWDEATESMEEAGAMNDSDASARLVSPAGDAATTGSATPPVAQIPTDLGRDIIYTAHLDLGSTDVAATTRDAISAVESVGGFLFSQDTIGGANASSVMVFKVLPEHFQSALSKLGSVGWVQGQSVSAEDVTAVVVDLESRIKTAEASVERLRKLLDESNDIERIASLEAQLMDRETTLERLRGQLRTVRDRVDLATITVTITPLAAHPAIDFSAFIYPGHDDGFSCFERSGNGRFEPGTPVTICYRATNIGDSTLTGLEIQDPTFGARVSDLRIVDGGADRLEPGQTVILAHEVVIEEAARLRTSIIASPIDPDGTPLADEVRFPAGMIRIDLIENDSDLPGLGETVANSWGALKTVAKGIALALAALLPFLPLIIVGWLGWRWLTGRRRTPTPTPPTTTAGAATDPATAADPAPVASTEAESVGR